MKKRLSILFLFSLLFFSGCAQKDPEPILVYQNNYGQNCTYESPYNTPIERLMGAVIEPAYWKVLGIFGEEKPCLTDQEWIDIELSTRAMMQLYGSVKNFNTALKQTRPLQPATVAYKQNTSNACTSDIDCGLGNSCVKPQFSSSGTCMKKVNSLGNQSFDLKPAPIGIQVKPECRFDSECSFGFKCISGHCLK